MNAFGVGPKDVGLLPGRAAAGPGEDVAVGVERLLKSDDVGPRPTSGGSAICHAAGATAELLARPFLKIRNPREVSPHQLLSRCGAAERPAE